MLVLVRQSSLTLKVLVFQTWIRSQRVTRMQCYLKSRKVETRWSLEPQKSSRITLIQFGLLPLKQLLPLKKINNSLFKYTMQMMVLHSMIFPNKILSDSMISPCIKLSPPESKLSQRTCKIQKGGMLDKSKLLEKNRKMAGVNSLPLLMCLAILLSAILSSLWSVNKMEPSLSPFTRVNAERIVKMMASIILQFTQILILWLTVSPKNKSSSKSILTTVMVTIKWLEVALPRTEASLMPTGK